MCLTEFKKIFSWENAFEGNIASPHSQKLLDLALQWALITMTTFVPKDSAVKMNLLL